MQMRYLQRLFLKSEKKKRVGPAHKHAP